MVRQKQQKQAIIAVKKVEIIYIIVSQSVSNE